MFHGEWKNRVDNIKHNYSITLGVIDVKQESIALSVVSILFTPLTIYSPAQYRPKQAYNFQTVQIIINAKFKPLSTHKFKRRSYKGYKERIVA